MNGEYLFKTAVGNLRLPFETYDEMTPYEIVILENQRIEADMESASLLQTALWYNELSKSKKRFVPMYKKEKKAKTKEITADKRNETLSVLSEVFGAEQLKVV